MPKLKDKIGSENFAALKRLKVMGLTILILTAAIATYFTSYISHQREYFTSRNFRELSSFSNQLSSRMGNLREGFKNAVSGTINERAHALGTAKTDCPGKDEQQCLKEAFEQSLTILAPTKFSNIKVDPLPTFKDSGEVAASRADLKVAINVALPGDSLLELACQNGNPKMPGLNFRASINFADLIKSVIGERTEIRGSEQQMGFDDVLVADENGDVIYDQNTPELDIISLKDISFFETPEKKLEFKTLTTTTSSADVRLAGADYKFYLQPVTVPVPRIRADNQPAPYDQTSHWVVCGLVEASHFRHQTWAMSSNVMVFLVFLCALVTLSWSLLKLWFIGPKDRLRLADVYFLSLSFLLGSALLTLLLLWGHTYMAHQNELDRKLEVLANDIAGRFQSEVETALGQLKSFDSELLHEIESTGSGKPSAFKKDTQHVGYSRTGILEKQLTSGSISYPYFNSIVWMSEGGEQKILWTLHNELANLHNVSDRPYFRNIIKGEFFSLKDTNFSLQSINSRATGQKTVMISKVSDFKKRWLNLNETKSTSSDSKGQGQIGVVAMDTNLRAVMSPVMPESFGYRIIDEKGNVLFHSDESKQWEEVFFAETDDNRQLRSLVAERLGGSVDINYGGRAHHIYVKPLDNFPKWTLIVFRNKQPLRALYGQIVTLAGFLFAAYALILFALFWIIYLSRVNPRAHTKWLWPSPASTALYSEFIVVNFLWGLLLIADLVVLDGLWLILMVTLTSLLGIANLFFRSNFAVIRKLIARWNIQARLDYRSAYTMNIVMVLVIVGILPAVAFFKVTYNKGMRLSILQEQRSIWKGYEARRSRIEARYSTNRDPGNVGPFSPEAAAMAGEFIDCRLRQTSDIYGDFNNIRLQLSSNSQSRKLCPGVGNSTGTAPVQLGTEQMRSSLATGQLIRSRLTGLLLQIPFASGMVGSEILAPSSAADGSWIGRASGDIYTLRIPNGFKGQSLLITTPLRRFESLPSSPTVGFIVGILLFLFILVTLYFVARFAVRRIFLLHLEGCSITPVPQNGFMSTSQNLFVIISSPLIDKNSAPCNGKLYRVDCKEDGSFEELKKRIQSKALPKKIVLDHFDHKLSDLKTSFQKLELLEQLLADEKVVVIISNVDPSAYSAPELFRKSEQKNGSALEYADRWANVAACFAEVYLVESGDKNCFEKLVSRREAALLSLWPNQKKRISELMRLMRAECSSRGCLQKIGAEIIKQTGLERISVAEILKQVSGQARLYYQRIWATSSEQEKLTLIHLAEDKFLSLNDPHLDILLRKGLIVIDPDLRLMNQTFKDFLLTQCSQTGLTSIEDQAKRNSTWHMLKVPLITGFVGVLLFLFLTQKEFYGSSLTIVTGLATGIPALFKILSLFHGEGVGKIASSAAAGQ